MSATNVSSLPTSASYPRSSHPLFWLNNSLKRLFDVLIAALGLLVLAPIFTYIAVRIQRESPGPVFYRGARTGKDGKTFGILKFRTMHERPESYAGPRVTAQDDPRITPLGKWLRDSKLNEFPQLWNVLKGEMSLVGPRPEDPEIAATWPEDVRREVLSVRPGITSPASVLYRDEENLLKSAQVMDIYLDEILPSKLRLDQLYVRHRSFWGDLDILFWTALVLLPKVRTQQPDEEYLLFGPLTRLMKRYINWFTLDLLVTLAAIGTAGLIWRSFGSLDRGWTLAIGLALGFALLFSLANALLGVNRIAWSRAAATDVLDLLPGAALATGIALLFIYLYPDNLIAIFYGGVLPAWVTRPLFPPTMILFASVLACVGFVIARYRERLITGLATRWVAWRGAASISQERVLVVGGGATGQFAAWMLNNEQSNAKMRVVGFVDDDLYKQGARIHGLNVLGRREDIPALVSRHDIGILIFAIHNIRASERRRVLDICALTPARLVLFPDIPAALGSIARNGRALTGKHGAGQPSDLAEQTFPSQLPCYLCLTKVSPLKVHAWLAQIETLADNGDLEALRVYTHSVRKQVRGDAAAQLNANLAEQDE